MRIKPVEFSLALEDDKTRSEGLHLSEVIRVLALRFGHLKPEYEDSDLNPEVIGLGRAFEDWVNKQHPEMIYHPGEVVQDGIAMTCDGVSWEGDEVRVHEIKLTWKSSKRELADEWMWLAQLKSYCKGWGTTRGRMHRYYVNGDYKRESNTRRYYVDDIDFTKREIEENWDLMLQGREYMEEEHDKAGLDRAAANGRKRGKGVVDIQRREGGKVAFGLSGVRGLRVAGQRTPSR